MTDATFQPIFEIGRGGALKLRGLRAGMADEPTTSSTETTALLAPLAIRNFSASASGAIDLYLDEATVGAWSTAALARWMSSEGMALEGQIHLEASRPIGARTGPFRHALVSDGCDDQLDVRIARLRPGVVRMESRWVANLTQHRATRSLLTTLVGVLKRRGVRTLFEGLNNYDGVSFAIECGAVWLQGDALAPAFAAGERVEDHVPSAGTNVVPVHFSRQKRPLIA